MLEPVKNRVQPLRNALVLRIIPFFFMEGSKMLLPGIMVEFCSM
jgi:hypothetical protein